MISRIVFLLSITMGSALGWLLGARGSIMVSYLGAIVGTTLGIIIGRRWQRWLDGDD